MSAMLAAAAPAKSADPKLAVWSPAASPVRIEYPATLFDQARLHGAQGNLYGFRAGDVIRIGAAAGDENRSDRVGIFSVRPHGEVFLTEPDLERFERTRSAAALVIAGSSAGFFVRNPDGSLQSIRSYQEIPCAMPPSRRPPILLPIAATLVVAMGLAANAAVDRVPLEISVHENAGQIVLSWTPARGSLEIRDGTDLASMPVSPSVSKLTYAPSNPEIEIRLTSGAQSKSLRFTSSDAFAAQLAALRYQVDALEIQVVQLGAETGEQRWRIAGLQRKLSTIINRAD